MPAIRSVLGTVRTQRVMSKYKTQAPTIKPGIADRLREIERAAGPADVVASRCCGKCRTPYNCGNKGCGCHSADEVRARLAS